MTCYVYLIFFQKKISPNQVQKYDGWQNHACERLEVKETGRCNSPDAKVDGVITLMAVAAGPAL